MHNFLLYLSDFLIFSVRPALRPQSWLWIGGGNRPDMPNGCQKSGLKRRILLRFNVSFSLVGLSIHNFVWRIPWCVSDRFPGNLGSILLTVQPAACPVNHNSLFFLWSSQTIGSHPVTSLPSRTKPSSLSWSSWISPGRAILHPFLCVSRLPVRLCSSSGSSCNPEVLLFSGCGGLMTTVIGNATERMSTTHCPELQAEELLKRATTMRKWLTKIDCCITSFNRWLSGGWNNCQVCRTGWIII